jgi:F0F1-type ATP synthase membrane subunit b/b'
MNDATYGVIGFFAIGFIILALSFWVYHNQIIKKQNQILKDLQREIEIANEIKSSLEKEYNDISDKKKKLEEISINQTNQIILEAEKKVKTESQKIIQEKQSQADELILDAKLEAEENFNQQQSDLENDSLELVEQMLNQSLANLKIDDKEANDLIKQIINKNL